MASTSGSEQDVEDQWDDMAIVRAFEEALTDQRSRSSKPVKSTGRTQQAVASQSSSKGTNQSIATDERCEVPKSGCEYPASSAAPRARETYGESHAGVHADSSARTSPFDYQKQQQQSDLYQAAYAQAFAQLQAQFQAAYPPTTSQPFGPSIQMPAQSPCYLPAAPSPSIPMPFSGMPAGQIPGSAVPGPAGPDDGLANVLMSWYQSGYYTGRFQAMQEMKMRGYR
uniref:Survival motor neuron Tudor domain-containing protein n=1 Tax=Peronospora matthiolae TaxID=2874970 RepID=A0AAV1TH96_9STRA